MSKKLFEDYEDLIWHEDVSDCEEFLSGLIETEIYFCPAMFLSRIKIPNILGTFTSAGTISENLVCKKRRGFYKLRGLIEQNDLTAQVSDNSTKTSLTIYLLGLKANRIGLARKFKMIPGVYLVKDLNQRFWVIGTDISPAFATCELNTGKKFDDDSGMQIKLTSNSIFYQYSGAIPLPPESDFSDEFSFEFY